MICSEKVGEAMIEYSVLSDGNEVVNERRMILFKGFLIVAFV